MVLQSWNIADKTVTKQKSSLAGFFVAFEYVTRLRRFSVYYNSALTKHTKDPEDCIRLATLISKPRHKLAILSTRFLE